MAFATIKTTKEIQDLFKHVLKDHLGMEPAADDKLDANALFELIEMANIKFELTVTYDKFVPEKVEDKKIGDDDPFL